MNASTALARLVVDELVRHGVRDAVLAPGSRSAALALALHDAQVRGQLRVHVRVDERSAGFVALGLARGSHRPVPVVTTSGSAVAHLHPAVLEAHHAGLPLVVVSADRPAELRGSGANQTTDQAGLFGGAVRRSVDVPADVLATAGVAGRELAVRAWRAQVARLLLAATGADSRDPGPVQLNCCFAPPLVPDEDDDGAVPPGRSDGRAWTTVADEPPDGLAGETPHELAIGPRTVVVAGADAGPRTRELAERAGWPLVAEPTSGARTGDHALRCGSMLLADPVLGGEVQRVVVAGRPTVSRPVTALLSRSDVELVALATSPRWADPGNQAAVVLSSATVTDRDDPRWRQRWVKADARASTAVDDVLARAADRLPAGTLLGAEVARAVSEAVPPCGLLVVGSSSPVRDLDLMARPYPVGERRLVVANRGLSGIDGTVSTAVGAALGRRSCRAFALLGDLTFCHDLGGLLLGPAEPRPDLTIVVAADDGGSIFATLEPGASRFAEAFERFFATPTGADLGALCEATGTPHLRVTEVEQLRSGLRDRRSGIRVLEAVVDRAGRRGLDGELRRAVAAALGEHHTYG